MMGPQERADLARDVLATLKSTKGIRWDDFSTMVGVGVRFSDAVLLANRIEDLEASKQRWKEATEAAHEAMEEQSKELEQVRVQRDELVKVARLAKRCRRSFLVGEAHDPAYRELAEVFASLSPATAALLEGE